MRKITLDSQDINNMGNMLCKCPYCGYENQDSWELAGGNGDMEECECRQCGRTFIYVTNIEVTYDSYKKEECTIED